MENKTKENRKHIGFFGRCNVGKSSLINALTNQEISIVSAQSGTTTDVVKKSIELYGVGAVVLLDTAGLDDNTILGEQRVKSSKHALTLVDAAVLVISENKVGDIEKEFLEQCKSLSVPCIVVYNKQDVEKAAEETKKQITELSNSRLLVLEDHSKEQMLQISSKLKEILSVNEIEKRTVLQGIVKPLDIVVLVAPIDSSAPEGRLILPQVQTIRDALDKACICIVVKETELECLLKEKGIKPDLIVTDSQVFGFVSKIVPNEIPLTSFSVLLSRMKGAFEQYLKGTPYLDKLKDGDKVLMLESCTHQPTCEDIGRVKLPMMIRKYTGKDIKCEAVSGLTKIETPLSEYAMIIQCGGCVATAKQIHSRLQPALDMGIAVSNYGLAIAYMNGIFNRVTAIFK
jgi:[FeFe] hydrogenase H-cluster maturation GTPase HydF